MYVIPVYATLAAAIDTNAKTFDKTNAGPRQNVRGFSIDKVIIKHKRKFDNVLCRLF